MALFLSTWLWTGPRPCVWLFARVAHELRETFYFLYHQFIMKRYNTGPCTGEGLGASMPVTGAPFSLNLHMSINLVALQTLSFWVFMEASRHRHWANHWPLITELHRQPPLLPRGVGGGGWLTGSTNHMAGSTSNCTPILRSFPKVTSLKHNDRHFHGTYHLENSKGFRRSVPRRPNTSSC